MMRQYEVLALALAGMAFSGYLSAVKLFSAACALTVPCPLFLGYPACYFGFAMFALLAILAFFWSVGKQLRSWIIGVSTVGTLFALYFSVLEWQPLVALTSNFLLLAVPSCVVGLLVYASILVISLRAK